MGLQQPASERRKGSEGKDNAIVAAMAAHQMPTTAPGMPHPNAVMATQYAHSQPQPQLHYQHLQKQQLQTFWQQQIQEIEQVNGAQLPISACFFCFRCSLFCSPFPGDVSLLFLVLLVFFLIFPPCAQSSEIISCH
jgi:hypothetical protein